MKFGQSILRASLAAVFAMSAVGVHAPLLGAQQTGIIRGIVVDEASARPIELASVSIDGTQLGSMTDANGRYTITNVPLGPQTVRVRLIGYGSDARPVVVGAAAAEVNFRLQRTAIRIADFVVTGVSGVTEAVKLPFEVAKVTAADIPVPAVTAIGALQGKIAGATVVQGSGRPGSAPSIMLRGPTSINSQGRTQEPLVIVDGVILGGDVQDAFGTIISGGLSDVDPNDIESIEVVKGAAAASLYGSRAANGVINITTRSGASLAENSTNYTLRTEYGVNQLAGEIGIARNHGLRMNAGQTRFVNGAGVEFDWVEQARIRSLGGDYLTPLNDVANGWLNFQDNVWPGPVYDHVDELFDPGSYGQTTITASGRSASTNYHLSLSNLLQQGVLYNLDGFSRTSLRVNLDQGVRQDLQVSVRTSYSRSKDDGQNSGDLNALGPQALFSVTRMPYGVSLFERDDNGDLILLPDLQGENDNPIYGLANSERNDERERFLGGINLRYSPLTWFDLEGNASYDRANVNRNFFFDKGFKTAREDPTLNDGYVFRDGWLTEAVNGSVTATVRRTFGDLNTRTQARYLYEGEHFDYVRASGSTLAVEDVTTVTGAQTQRITRSSIEDTRSEGYFLISNFDFRDRYIIDALVRRDGSSLFGSNERWQTYWRAAGAWRLSQEQFWTPLSDELNEFKLRYSVGTAGGRPRFNAQYESYYLVDGVVSGGENLGNADLKPEHVTEHEAGIDLRAFDRVDFTLNYATSTAKDQILRIPLSAPAGFQWQWRNAGTLKSHTLEATLGAQIMQRRDFSWSGRLLFDRTRQRITELNVPEYQYGFDQQPLEAVFLARSGERIGTFYGYKFAKSCGDLPTGTDCGNFMNNDDGYFVYVGPGATYLQGMNGGPGGAPLWGTDGPVINGNTVKWGAPVIMADASGDQILPLGNTTPDFNMAWSNTFNYKRFTVYGLLDGTFGPEIYNVPRHWAYFENYSADQDQAGKPDELKKPQSYYSLILYKQLGPPNSHFVEDGSFVKLREVSVRYSFSPNLVSRIPLMGGGRGIAVSLIGRNLYTWTDYTGYDPEVGYAGGDTGSAAIGRFDGFAYPNFRSFTGALEITF
jgi:TonB-linked SusC/RagA family outer membrane protein